MLLYRKEKTGLKGLNIIIESTNERFYWETGGGVGRCKFNNPLRNFFRNQGQKPSHTCNVVMEGRYRQQMDLD